MYARAIVLEGIWVRVFFINSDQTAAVRLAAVRLADRALSVFPKRSGSVNLVRDRCAPSSYLATQCLEEADSLLAHSRQQSEQLLQLALVSVE